MTLIEIIKLVKNHWSLLCVNNDGTLKIVYLCNNFNSP